MKRSALALIITAAAATALAGAIALAQSTAVAPPAQTSQDQNAPPAGDNAQDQPPPDETQPSPSDASPAQPGQEQQSAKPLGAGSAGPNAPAQSLGQSAAGQGAQVQNPALAPPAIPMGPPAPAPNAILVMTGLDKITGRPTPIVARLNRPVEFATLTITVRYCYSTPPSETPETIAFLQIDDRRPDQPHRRVFSGWMYASTPGLNGLQHPLYDVWVISCSANAPGQVRPTVASNGPVKVLSPDSTDTQGLPSLPEGAGQ
jgi:hypothetical protein